MTTESDEVTVEEPTLEFVEAEESDLAPNEILLAEGTDIERRHTLKIPRGKQFRDKHRKLLATFGELESVASSMQGGSSIRPIVDAIERLFTMKDFEDVMLPFALQMDSPEDIQYLDSLLPLEKFKAYMAAASYIVSGGQTEETRAAIKK